MIDGAWKPLPDSSVLAATASRFRALVNRVNSCFGARSSPAAIYSGFWVFTKKHSGIL